MKRTALTLILISALLPSTVAVAFFMNLSKANFIAYLPEIVIKSDGGVEPETELIKQTGNVYFLTANLSQSYAIRIQRSNIIFDGDGHFINGTLPGAGYANVGLRLENVTNVTVRNIQVSGFASHDIGLGCTNCSILNVNVRTIGLGYSELGVFVGCAFNTIANSIFGTLDVFSVNNTITRCTHTNWLPIYVTGASNTFFENNLGSVWLAGSGINFWDNGSVGNYWSNYLPLYPNASGRGNSGIGDTSYVVDANNIDHYPLMAPFLVDDVAPSMTILSPEDRTYATDGIALNFTVNEALTQIMYSLDGEENVTISGNTTLTGLANGDHNLTIYAKDKAGNVGASETTRFVVNAPFPIALVIAASGVSAAIIGVSLIVHFKKHNEKKNLNPRKAIVSCSEYSC